MRPKIIRNTSSRGILNVANGAGRLPAWIAILQGHELLLRARSHAMTRTSPAGPRNIKQLIPMSLGSLVHGGGDARGLPSITIKLAFTPHLIACATQLPLCI